jgi:hypothetical protein
VSVRRDPSRYEIKIPWPSHYLPHVERWVRLHPAQWRVAYPPRQVNNVYFDTAAYRGLNANLSGVADRAKLRLRWYGPQLTPVTGSHLELKRKAGMAGWKREADVAATLHLARTPWPEILHDLRAALPAVARAWLDDYAHPVLVNHYRRAYYVTPDGAVRLTLDTDLHAYDQRYSALPNLRHPARCEEVVVVELKTEMEHAARLSALLAHFPVRSDRYSKYVQGMLAAPDFSR